MSSGPSLIWEVSQAPALWRASPFGGCSVDGILQFLISEYRVPYFCPALGPTNREAGPAEQPPEASCGSPGASAIL